MFDSHCHLQVPALDATRTAVIARAEAAGVGAFLLAGVDGVDWARQQEVRRVSSRVHLCFGLHPQRVGELAAAEVDHELRRLELALDGDHALDASSVVAIGETGLDGSDPYRASLDAQQSVFRRQLALARERRLPVVLHVLRAHGAALEILRTDGVGEAGGVVHSYSGPADLVAAYVKLGLSISLAGSVTRPNARKALDAARAVPRDRLLVETDAPYQAPSGRPPGHNEPAYLVDIVAAVARARSEAADDVARYTEENAYRLFRIPRPFG